MKIMRNVSRIICALSGGVDSTVSAVLLKSKGFIVQGVYMRNWDQADELGNCAYREEQQIVESICRRLQIQFNVVDFVKEYWNDVFVPMLASYTRGTTPNPDIMCNRHIKFAALHRYAVEHLGANFVATGHYARLERSPYSKEVRLLRGVDERKDQSFFLSQVSQQALRQSLFPVGDLLKSEVKKMAIEAGFADVARRKESVGLCFVGKRNFSAFVENYIAPQEGPFVEVETGRCVGTHKGVHYWTIGQRCRISVDSKAYFVASLDAQSNTVYVAPHRSHPALYVNSFEVHNLHWIRPLDVGRLSANHSPTSLPSANCSSLNNMTSPGAKERKFSCFYKTQHVDPIQKCHVTISDDSQKCIVDIDFARAIAPGQYCVFYDGDECMGSAEIIRTGPSLYEQQRLQNLKESL